MIDTLKKYINENKKGEIINFINNIHRDETLLNSCFNIIVDLFYDTEDQEILNSIDWCLHFALKIKQLERINYIITHPKYDYSKIRKNQYIHSAVFHNNQVVNQLYSYFALKNAKKHLLEIMELINNNNKINLSSLNMNVEDKVKCFYITMGAITLNIQTNMNICFNLLEDDELLEKDKELMIVFARFYGWNYMGASEKFISKAIPISKSQKELIEMLKIYVDGVKEENFYKKLSHDFDIDSRVLEAKRRIDIEQNKKINEKSEQESIFSRFFPPVRILIGEKVVNIFEEESGKIVFRKTSMQHINIEYEIPLDHILSPLDFQDTLNFLLNGGAYETNN